MLLDILSSNPYPSVIPGFIVNLIKDNAFNNLCGKTLRILSFCPKDKVILWRNMFLETFWQRVSKEGDLAPLIYFHDPG